MREGTGLRERKRHAAMCHVQDVALDLFDQDGFDAVTVERIAAAAEVSPMSVYRYFGTKEGIVLWNPYRHLTLSQLSAYQPEPGRHPLMTVLRQMTAELLSDQPDRAETSQRRRTRYIMEVPALRAALVGHLDPVARRMTEVLAERTGRQVTDLKVQVTVGALFGALFAALHHWHADGYATPLGEVLDQTLASLQHGLELD